MTHPCAVKPRMNGAPKLGIYGWATRPTRLRFLWATPSRAVIPVAMRAKQEGSGVTVEVPSTSNADKAPLGSLFHGPVALPFCAVKNAPVVVRVLRHDVWSAGSLCCATTKYTVPASRTEQDEQMKFTSDGAVVGRCPT